MLKIIAFLVDKAFGQTTKQPLNSFEPQKPLKYKQLRGLRPDPIINFMGKMFKWIVLHRGTNDQIIPRGRSFTKCIFHQSENIL